MDYIIYFISFIRVPSFISVLLICLLGCETKEKDFSFELKNIGNKSIKVDSLTLDTIKIQGNHTSLVGKWACRGDSLIWGDYLYGAFYVYDTNFMFKQRYMKQGRGPNEVPFKRWTNFSFHNNNISIWGTSNNYCLLDINLKVQKKDRLEFVSPGIKYSTLKNNPKPSYIGIYEINYPKMIVKYLSSNVVLIPISTTHPLLNGFTTKKFYSSSFCLGIVDLEKSSIKRLLGNYSPIYLEYKFIPQFCNVLYDNFKEDKTIISYEADSTIYILDNESLELTSKFGYSGSNMSYNYPEVHSYDNYTYKYQSAREKYGYYKYLKYISQEDILFRGYKKDNGHQSEGLQIYKGCVLIADIEVPLGMEVIGYSEPYFYAQKNEEINIDDNLILYRFKLKL